MTATDEVTQRADALRNRERILEAAVVELTLDPNVSLTAIAKKAHVGQGTLYRHFADREALLWAVFRREVQGLLDAADQLLAELPPDRALREWLARLAAFALTKADLGGAVRGMTPPADKSARPGYTLVLNAIERLLTANREGGTIGPDVTLDDFLLLIAGIWQIMPDGQEATRTSRLLDLVMAALQSGALQES